MLWLLLSCSQSADVIILSRLTLFQTVLLLQKTTEECVTVSGHLAYVFFNVCVYFCLFLYQGKTLLLTVVIKLVLTPEERHETFTEGRDFLHVSAPHGKNN